MPKAALRRHHDARKKAKVRHYFVCDAWDHVMIDGRQYLVRGPYPTEDPARIGQMARTPKPCSCWGCGNQRRHFGKRTVQERRQGWS